MQARARFVSVAVAAAVLAVVWLWLLGQVDALVGAPSTPPARSPVPPRPATGASVEGDAPSERAEVDLPTTGPELPDLRLAHVRGRCVDELGRALAGCTAKLDAWGGNADRMAMQGKVDWHDPEPIVTGDDGRFDFAIVPPSGMQFSLDVRAAGRVPRTGRWGTIAPEQDVDLGDVALARGFTVAGRVLDERGIAVAQAGVTLKNLPLPLASNMAANSSRSGSSALDGTFAIDVSTPSGSWPLDVHGRGLRLVGPDRVTIADRDVHDLVVTVRRMPSIEGMVVDEFGVPVKGVGVRAMLNRSGRMASARSREDGAFTIYAVDAEPKPVQLQVDDPGPCEPPEQVDETAWEWGSRGVRFVLRRATSVELTVVERDGGAPVTQYAVSCYNAKAPSSLQRDLRLAGEHEGGRVIVDRVWRGKTFLKVVPVDRGLMPSSVLEFEVGDAGMAPIRVELERLRFEGVAVRTSLGEAVMGSRVELVRRGTREFDAGSFTDDLRTSSGSWSTDPGYRAHVLLGSGISDENGRAMVPVPSDKKDLALRVTGTHPAVVVDPAVFVPGQDLVIAVPDGGAIVGTVLLVGLSPTDVRVQLLDAENRQLPGNVASHPLDGDGGFVLRGLEPGRYRLQLLRTTRYRTEHGSSGGSAGLDVQIPKVLVTAGQETAITIDASSLVPATLVGRVLLDGVAPSASRVFVQAEKGPVYGQFVPDENGVFTAEDLLPGSYRIGLVVGDFVAGEGDRLLGDETFTLGAGQRLERVFSLTRLRLTITVLEADGKTPAADLDVWIQGSRVQRQGKTDAAGVLVIDPAPSGPLRLSSRRGAPAAAIEVPPGRNEFATTVTLPASR